MDLNNKQKRFCEEYLIDNNAKKAAIRAGYSEKCAAVHASRLMKKPEINAYLYDLIQKRSEMTQITSAQVLFDLQEVVAKCLGRQSVSVSEVVRDPKKGKVSTVQLEKFCFDPSGANRALELMGKHLGMWVDKTEITGKDGEPLVMSDAELAAKIAGILAIAKERADAAS